jgi:DNA-directed RNA polymerase subunit RPC12/RpoP
MLNLRRKELLTHARQTLRLFPRARVFFKYTCQKCGTRVTFKEPNQLFERGECHQCGHEQPVTEGGYLLDVVPRG